MVWIYIVSWTLTFNAFDYGKLEGNFEKKFLNRSEAVKFMDGYDLPKGCCVGYKNFELDSVPINTSTVEEEQDGCDPAVLYRWNNPPRIQFYYDQGRLGANTYIQDGMK